MGPPNMDALNLSDSDSDSMFDTPAAKKNKKKGHDEAGDVTDGAAAGKTRGKESHYTTEETREARLRQELESVRNVNKVIEGVVESLQKAKDNMGVRSVSYISTISTDSGRRYPGLCTMHPPFSKRGLASSPKRSTTSASF